MQSLQTNQTSDGASANVLEVSGLATVVFEDSIFDGATVVIEIAGTNAEANFRQAGPDAMTGTGNAINVQVSGNCFLRAKVSGAGLKTNITSGVL